MVDYKRWVPPDGLAWEGWAQLYLDRLLLQHYGPVITQALEETHLVSLWDSQSFFEGAPRVISLRDLEEGICNP